MHRYFLALIAGLTPTLALAQDAGAPQAADPIMGLLPLVFIFVVFYFLLIRPQRRRMQDHDAMTRAVKKGDHVLTSGGIVGKVSGAEGEQLLLVEIAPGVEVKVSRAMISTLLDKDGKPAKLEKPASGKNDNVAVSSQSIANDN
jgi:preprotein translocase subunit YajC